MIQVWSWSQMVSDEQRSEVVAGAAGQECYIYSLLHLYTSIARPTIGCSCAHYRLSLLL
jgi:hypothetical protein